MATIKTDDEVWELLNKAKIRGESMNEVLRRILNLKNIKKEGIGEVSGKPHTL